MNDDNAPESGRYYEGPDRALEEVVRLQSRAFSRFFDLIVREFIGTERFSGILDEAINSTSDEKLSGWESAGYPVDRKVDPGC